MEKQDKYTEQLEKVIKQMLSPLKDVPFNLVVETLSGNKVIPFDKGNEEDARILDLLKKVALLAGKNINKDGISSRRANEVGNYIETFVKQAMEHFKLKPDIPSGKSGRRKNVGYPDIVFYFCKKPYYLECKTYNQENISTTLRSFYFSPSDDFKVIYDTHHFVLSYEMMTEGQENGINIYKCKHYKILSIENLSLDVKYEFNSDNKRVYSGIDGTRLLDEGDV